MTFNPDALRKEFADYCTEVEPGIKAHAPKLNQLETLALIGMTLFQAAKELKDEKAEMAARIAALESTEKEAVPLCYAVSIEVASAQAKERTSLDTCTKRHGAYDTPLYLHADSASNDAIRREALDSDLSLQAKYEDACIEANKNAQDAQRWRYVAQHTVIVDASVEGMISLTIARAADSGACEVVAERAIDALSQKVGDQQ